MQYADQGIRAARDCFTGKSLSVSQFDTAIPITDIIHRGIQKAATFTEQLTDFSHAFARTERFDQMKAETIIRDLFKARFGQTMNEMREGMLEREKNLPEHARGLALEKGRDVVGLMRDNDEIPFYRAHDFGGHAVAQELNISEMGAKALIREEFRKAEGQELYDVCKGIEQSREQASQSPEPRRSRARSGYRRA